MFFSYEEHRTRVIVISSKDRITGEVFVQNQDAASDYSIQIILSSYKQ